MHKTPVRLAGEHLVKDHDHRRVLADVTFATTPGRPLALRGPNGCGKTTLLRCLAGAEPLDGGTVVLDGRPQPTASATWWTRVHALLDDLAWFPDLTLADHLALHQDPRTPATARGERTRRALERFGVDDLGDRCASSLSSGQARRAALATLLVREADVVLLDEPEQRLDAAGLDALVTTLTQLAEAGRAVVLATHSDALTSALGAEVLDMGAL